VNDQRSPEFVSAVARALEVLGCFDAEHRRMTLTQVAQRTGLTRGTSRRFLLTLETLRFLESDGKQFWLTPKVLTLANAYLTSFGVGEAAKAVLKRLTEVVQESASMAVLEGGQITYIARADAPRRFATALRLTIGSQLPAHCSSMGRALLASFDERQLKAWLAEHPLTALTERTITDPVIWQTKIAEVRRDGFAIVDSEMELGLRSMAVPVFDRTGRAVAAVNVATLTGRTPLEELHTVVLPALKKAASDIAPLLEHR
jgi:IclR family transcriptional regulator, pca regulon regulatory protein